MYIVLFKVLLFIYRNANQVVKYEPSDESRINNVIFKMDWITNISQIDACIWDINSCIKKKDKQC